LLGETGHVSSAFLCLVIILFGKYKASKGNLLMEGNLNNCPEVLRDSFLYKYMGYRVISEFINTMWSHYIKWPGTVWDPQYTEIKAECHPHQP
jgi:hypothetical protein